MKAIFKTVRPIAIYLIVWAVVLAGLIAQARWGIASNWSQATVRVTRWWAAWVVVGPAIWWLVKRFQIFGNHRWRNLGIHFVASLSMIVIAEVINAKIIYPVTRPVMEEAASSGRQSRRAEKGLIVRNSKNDTYHFRSQALVRRVQMWLPLYWVFVFLASSVLQRREAQERERRSLILQKDLVSAQLTSLQSRLQPHFLFNALNSIAALIHDEPDKAEEMVTRLSDLLRNVLKSDSQTEISLREELQLLRDYLAIEVVRFSDRLTIVEEIDEETLSCLLPPLTLQPIAENAVKHGVEPKSDPSVIIIKASLEIDRRVRLQIVDDGVGCSAAANAGSGLGIGLENVRERLEAMYPGNAELDIVDVDTGGTQVTITIPAREA